jgi:UDP-galactose transporter B1
VIYNIIEFGVTSAIGQIFIYQTIAHFGPLTCSIITTTRKFFTILASVVIFGHSLILRQWMGVSLVFLGLSLDIYFSNRDRMSRKDESDNKMASSDDKRTLNHTK